VTTQEIMLRLLKLEQRFDSYCGLYEDELTQLRTDIRDLRQGLLANLQAASRDGKGESTSPPPESSAGVNLATGVPIADI